MLFYLFPCCTILMLQFFQVAHFFHVAAFSSLILFMVHSRHTFLHRVASFHVVPFLHSFHVGPFSVLNSFHVVPLFVVGSFHVAPFFFCISFPVALFTCCNFFILHFFQLGVSLHFLCALTFPHIAHFSYCTLSYRTHFMLHLFPVAHFSCCTLFIIHFPRAWKLQLY